MGNYIFLALVMASFVGLGKLFAKAGIESLHSVLQLLYPVKTIGQAAMVLPHHDLPGRKHSYVWV